MMNKYDSSEVVNYKKEFTSIRTVEECCKRNDFKYKTVVGTNEDLNGIDIYINDLPYDIKTAKINRQYFTLTFLRQDKSGDWYQPLGSYADLLFVKGDVVFLMNTNQQKKLLEDVLKGELKLRYVNKSIAGRNQIVVDFPSVDRYISVLMVNRDLNIYEQAERDFNENPEDWQKVG